MSARVSVIIPAYNAGAYLSDSLDSVFAGTYQDFHIFLCDDGSSDDTLGVARRHQERFGKMTIVENKRNRGVGYTRNRLLDMADGEYIAFHDGDDLMAPGRLQVQVEFLDACADIDAAGGQLYVFTDDPGRSRISAHRPLADEDIKIYWTFSMAVTICTTIMRRECLRATAIRFDKTYKAGSDYEFFSRLLPHMRFANIAAPLEFYRVHAASITQRFSDLQIANHVKAAKQYLRTCFNIDAQDDVIGILTWPQYYPPRGVTADQSRRLQCLIVGLLNTDLVRNGGVTDVAKRFISQRSLTYFTRIPLDRPSVIDLRPFTAVSDTPMSVIKRRIKWYILCVLEITRLWRLWWVRHFVWKHQHSPVVRGVG